MAEEDDDRLRSRATPRQRRSMERRQAILAATADLLATHSPQSLSTSLIAARAGVPVSSIYAYFPNKQAVIAELLREALAEVDDQVEALLPAELTEESVLHAIDALIDAVLAGYRDVAARQRLFMAMRGDDLLMPVLEASDARSVAAVTAHLGRLLPDIPPPRIEAVAQTIVHTFSALQSNAVRCTDEEMLGYLVAEWRALMKAYLLPLTQLGI